MFAEVAADHPVADIGCGYGRAIPILDGFGIRNYLGVDFSEEQIRRARRKYPMHRFEVCNLYDLGKKYRNALGGFMLIAVFMCVPRHRAIEALSSIRASLKSGAVGFLSTRKGLGALINTNGMPVHYYDPEDFICVLQEVGFHLEGFLDDAMLQAFVRKP